MGSPILERLRESLSERRLELASWLRKSPRESLDIRVGPEGIAAVEAELRVMDEALEGAEAGTLGICTVCHETVEDGALEMDYAATVCLAHLSGDERSRLENDLELSQKVQKGLLPQDPPRIAGLEVAAFSRPALIVGGDYFDFITFRDGAPGFIIADVMGKGMAASLLMASFQASLRIIAPESDLPHEAIARLNKIFRHNIRLTRFVTAFLARYDEASGTLSYCNAGHNPPLLGRKGEQTSGLRPNGAAIGLAEAARFGTVTVPFRSGDRLLAYTDGVVELPGRGSEMFGEERVGELFDERMRDESAREMVRTLRTALEQYGGSPMPHDDTTIIAVVAE